MQGDHSPDNVKFTDISLTVHGTPHVKSDSYHACTSATVSGGGRNATVHDPKPYTEHLRQNRLLLNTCMDANMQFTINSFRQLFPDKIFSLTFPWFLVKSLTFPWQLPNPLTFPGFRDKCPPWSWQCAWGWCQSAWTDLCANLYGMNLQGLYHFTLVTSRNFIQDRDLFLSRDAMQARFMPSCSVCVRVSVTFVHSVERNKHIFKIFSPSGSHTILVFPYQMAWQYSDGNPPNGDVECRWGRQKLWF